MNNRSNEWSATETEYAIKHWRDGKSAGAVAKLLNNAFGTSRTRNSVIGRVYRLGEGRPESPNTRKTSSRVVMARIAKAKPVSRVRVFSPPKPLPAPAVILADVSFARPWLERERGQCAFPLGEKGAIMSCCFPTDETYCTAHRQAMVEGREA